MRKVYRRIVWNEVSNYVAVDDDELSIDQMTPNVLYYIQNAKFSYTDFAGNVMIITYAAINEAGDYIEHTGEEEQTDKLIHELEVQGYSYYEILESLKI